MSRDRPFHPVNDQMASFFAHVNRKKNRSFVKRMPNIIWKGESCKEAMEVFQPAGHSALLGTSAADFSKGKANRTKYSDNIPDVPTQLLQFRGRHLPDSSTQDVKLNDFCKKKNI